MRPNSFFAVRVNADFPRRYSESSFAVTQTREASFSFKFYGTEVSIFGAKRGNHGLYQATLDSMMSEGTGIPNGLSDQFQTPLFSQTVQKGTHNVTIMNKEDKFLDIDFVSPASILLEVCLFSSYSRCRGRRASAATMSL